MIESGAENDAVKGLPGAAGPDFVSGAVRTWLISSIVGVFVSVLAVKLVFKVTMPVELAAGYSLALINSAAALVINIIAMRRKHERFVAWGTAGNLLRAIAVLAIVLSARLSAVVRFEPFVTAFLAGYFVFMIAEIIRLNRLNLRSGPGA